MIEYIAVAGVAQLVEQLIRNQQITGSSPVTSSIKTTSQEVVFSNQRFGREFYGSL